MPARKKTAIPAKKKSGSISKRRGGKTKFSAMFDTGSSCFVILGRSAFGSKAKKIKVNQNPAKGALQDRRHILHWDEVLKPTIERVMTNLYADLGRDKLKVARLVRKELEALGIKRLPKAPDKLIERMVIEVNSAPDNLIPDRADTNKAIEVVRGYVRIYIKTVSTEEFAEDCLNNNLQRMAKYKQYATEVFVRHNDGGDITSERNRIHGEILEFINGCKSPAELWNLLHGIAYSVTFDFSPATTRAFTEKAIQWQMTMSLNEDSDPQTQLKDLLTLLA